MIGGPELVVLEAGGSIDCCALGLGGEIGWRCGMMGGPDVGLDKGGWEEIGRRWAMMEGPE